MRPTTFHIRLFADDTSLTVAGKNLDLLLQRMNSEFPAIFLNLSKTKYLVFQPRQKVNSNLHPPLKIADQYLEQSYNIKYLGLVIDCFLSWHDHIDHISSKIGTCLPLFKLRLHSVG